MTAPIRLAGLAAVVLAAGLTGCAPDGDPTHGYTTVSQYPADVRTVAVPIWRRGTGEFRRDIEIRLTEALVKQIQAETPYKIVDKSRADTLLTGTLRQVDQRVMSYDPRTGQAREIQMRLVVDYTWKDLRSGEVLVEKRGFRVATEYIPAAPYSEDFFQGSEDALNLLAQRIVETLASPW